MDSACSNLPGSNTIPRNSPCCFSFTQLRVSLQHTEFSFKCRVGCCIIPGCTVRLCVCLCVFAHWGAPFYSPEEAYWARCWGFWNHLRAAITICCILNHLNKHHSSNENSRLIVFIHKNVDNNVWILLTQCFKNIIRFNLAIMSLASDCTLHPDILRIRQVNLVQII